MELRADRAPRVEVQEGAPCAGQLRRERGPGEVGELPVEVPLTGREVVAEDLAPGAPRERFVQAEVVLGVAADDVEEGPKKWLRSRTRSSTHAW